MIYQLSKNTDAPKHEIGGKAYNLIKMLNADLLVPGGFVLPVSFFESWFVELERTSDWQGLKSADVENLEISCNKLGKFSLSLSFNSSQASEVADAISKYPASTRFAVRSSSPEEDLEGASFAGAYETELGIKIDGLEAAIKKAFSSCLDFRIAIYKRHKGFATDKPRIAVAIQEQIVSEKAGVAFSINPINNDYDEAVINSNWGQGETVVAGLASPDFFRIEKTKNLIIERVLGSKETSIWLDKNGGTLERAGYKQDLYSLSDSEIHELTRQIIAVEEYYKRPMDIEWAFDKHHLYLLQARPITTHHPIEERLLTKPGAPRRLYIDITMSVQGIFDGISPMGSSVFDVMINELNREVFGQTKRTSIERSLGVISQGRMYFNLTNLMHVAGTEKIVKGLGMMDPLSKDALLEILDSMSHERNMTRTFARSQINRFELILPLVANIYKAVPRIFRANIAPAEAKSRWFEDWKKFKEDLESISDSDLSFGDFTDKVFATLAPFLFRSTLPIFPSSKIAFSKIRNLFLNPDLKTSQYLDRLDQFLPGNLTVEMGHTLYRLSGLLPDELKVTSEVLEDAIRKKVVSEAFLTKWNKFVLEFGHRGVKEIDVASPRFRENHKLWLTQLCSYAVKNDFSIAPLEQFATNQRLREESFAALKGMLTGRNLGKFIKNYKILEELGGFRETHKFVVVFAIDQIRQRILIEAEKLIDAERLNCQEDLFFLTVDQLGLGITNHSLDLKGLIDEAKKKSKEANQCMQVAPLIDSRGRFYRPKGKPAGEGEFVGLGVSTGLIKGKVKVLKYPDEKILLPGEILVARATDPAWTPLFVNAGGIILEIGGSLQHGALVAREYGRPCVTGILNATSLFQDGDLVEIDGNTGIVRQLDKDFGSQGHPL